MVTAVNIEPIGAEQMIELGEWIFERDFESILNMRVRCDLVPRLPSSEKIILAIQEWDH